MNDFVKLSWSSLSVSLCGNLKCAALYLLFDRQVRWFLATSPCVLNLQAHAFQPPVSSRAARVPLDWNDWYVRQFAAIEVPSLWSKEDWFARQFQKTAFFFALCWASCEQLSILSGGLYVKFPNKDDKCCVFSLFSLFFIYHFRSTPFCIVLISLSCSYLPSHLSLWISY